MALVEERTEARTTEGLVERWELARDDLVRFLDAPNTVRFEAVRQSLSAYVTDLTSHGGAQRAEQHELASCFNAMLWAVPGSAEMQLEAQGVRRALLRAAPFPDSTKGSRAGQRATGRPVASGCRTRQLDPPPSATSI
jgi:hypothetical protein